VVEAFRSIGIADDKAIAAAEALARHDPDMGILKADVARSKAM
jgi:hypothetical protein